MADPDDSERKRELKRAWYYRNREREIARAAQWAKDNREQNNTTRRAKYAADPDRIIAEVYTWRKDNPELFAYTNHKHHAKLRDIPFLLTFEEWCNIWYDSGKFAQRGHCKGQYVMARFGDIGPYAVGNVRIITCSDNVSEAQLGKRKPRRHD
jgi:hypothetical protein